MECSEGGTIEIIHAEWGSYDYGYGRCEQKRDFEARGTIFVEKVCYLMHVTGDVSNKCGGRSSCRIVAGYEDFPMHCQGERPQVDVYWKCNYPGSHYHTYNALITENKTPTKFSRLYFCFIAI